MPHYGQAEAAASSGVTTKRSVLKQVSLTRSENSGFGFSIIGGADTELPPIVCDVVDNSPADLCDQLTIGDVIEAVNNVPLVGFSTKQVLNSLNAAGLHLTLTLREDVDVRVRAQPYLCAGPADAALWRDVISQQDLAGVEEIIVKVHESPGATPKHSPKKSVDTAKLPPEVLKPVMTSPLHVTRRGPPKQVLAPKATLEELEASDTSQRHSNGSLYDNVPSLTTGGGERQRKGFETFVMTGDKIIRTGDVSGRRRPKRTDNADGGRKAEKVARVEGGAVLLPPISSPQKPATRIPVFRRPEQTQKAAPARSRIPTSVSRQSPGPRQPASPLRTATVTTTASPTTHVHSNSTQSVSNDPSPGDITCSNSTPPHVSDPPPVTRDTGVAAPAHQAPPADVTIVGDPAKTVVLPDTAAFVSSLSPRADAATPHSPPQSARAGDVTQVSPAEPTPTAAEPRNPSAADVCLVTSGTPTAASPKKPPRAYDYYRLENKQQESSVTEICLNKVADETACSPSRSGETPTKSSSSKSSEALYTGLSPVHRPAPAQAGVRTSRSHENCLQQVSPVTPGTGCSTDHSLPQHGIDRHPKFFPMNAEAHDPKRPRISPDPVSPVTVQSHASPARSPVSLVQPPVQSHASPARSPGSLVQPPVQSHTSPARSPGSLVQPPVQSHTSPARSPDSLVQPPVQSHTSPARSPNSLVQPPVQSHAAPVLSHNVLPSTDEPPVPDPPLDTSELPIRAHTIAMETRNTAGPLRLNESFDALESEMEQQLENVFVLHDTKVVPFSGAATEISEIPKTKPPDPGNDHTPHVYRDNDSSNSSDYAMFVFDIHKDTSQAGFEPPRELQNLPEFPIKPSPRHVAIAHPASPARTHAYEYSNGVEGDITGYSPDTKPSPIHLRTSLENGSTDVTTNVPYEGSREDRLMSSPSRSVGRTAMANNDVTTVSPRQLSERTDNRTITEASDRGAPPLSEQNTTGVPEEGPGGEADEEDEANRYHQPSKDADRASAARLAKRLYDRKGFQASDVARHLSKTNDFNQLIGEEYLKFLSFDDMEFCDAVRSFLKEIPLTGETQERERVLAHFSRRFMECQPGLFHSEDACHTLTCAVMLLNTDLHGQSVTRRMTLDEFIDNLEGLNDGDNFRKDILRSVYASIKQEALACDIDENGQPESTSPGVPSLGVGSPREAREQVVVGQNPFLETPNPATGKLYKSGYVMRKCCLDVDGKKVGFGKRGWKMFYASLKDMVLHLNKNEQAAKKAQVSAQSLRIHHSLATRASDYNKKKHVFRLSAADGSMFLFQTSDTKELQDWIDTINLVAATLSAPPLAAACGSQKRFQRPLLPSVCTKLNLRDQLAHHEAQVAQLERDLSEAKSTPPAQHASHRMKDEYRDHLHYLQFQLKKFKSYALLMQAKMTALCTDLNASLVEVAIGEVDEPPSSPQQRRKREGVPSSAADRYSYRAAMSTGGMDV